MPAPAQADQLLRAAVIEAHAAVTDPGRWVACAARISEATNAAGTSIFIPAPAPDGGPLGNHGTMVGAEADYFRHWIHLDPWNQALRGTSRYERAGETLFGSELVPETEFRRTPYYVEYGHRQDSGHKLFLKVCDASDRVAPVTHLSLSRSFRQPDFGDPEKSIVARLWPHLRQAVQAYALLRQIQATESLAEGQLNHWPLPCWVIRLDLWIEFANTAAVTYLQAAPWVRTAAGRLTRIGTLPPSALSALVAQAALGTGAQCATALPDATGTQLVRAALRVVPLRGAPLYATMWPQAAALLVLEQTSHDEHDWIRTHLAPHYKLTDMECRVLEHLANGLDPAGIGQALGISVVTVRTHLRALREKTGRRSQVELVRLALGR